MRCIFTSILASALLMQISEAFSPVGSVQNGRSVSFGTVARPSVTCFASHADDTNKMSQQESKISIALPAVDNMFYNFGKVCSCALLAASLSFAAAPSALAADDGGATSMANAKITTGGASTLQSGRTIAITRGVNLDRTDFSNQNLKGVAFQQSIVRDANFKNSNLVGASFFDATVDGSNFENTDLSQANFEMAQFNRASLKVRCSRKFRSWARVQFSSSLVYWSNITMSYCSTPPGCRCEGHVCFGFYTL